ncbi:uncharacterized protein LTR77_004239 [Saxophila tyrrhenica]|uniref:Uncharacterized protein n=1 Tax=Saxophila tyrrhenica TaxID=1690608 RepID=A0AAV9PGH1_9PEZI|nr:hypothetical protein LTR77_004239 [Saxophila tyrrhenica]
MDNSLLGTLPAELRLEIYRLVMLIGTTFSKTKSSKPNPSKPSGPKPPTVEITETGYARLEINSLGVSAPPLLLTCKDIRSEALPVFYQEICFVITLDGFNPETMLKWYDHCLKPPAEVLPKVWHDFMIARPVDRNWDNLMRWAQLYHSNVLIQPAFTAADAERQAATPGWLAAWQKKYTEMQIIAEMFRKVAVLRAEPRELVRQHLNHDRVELARRGHEDWDPGMKHCLAYRVRLGRRGGLGWGPTFIEDRDGRGGRLRF